MVPTNMWKKKVRNTGEKADKKDRERKDSREISIKKVLEVEISQMATYWFVIGWFDNQSA